MLCFFGSTSFHPSMIFVGEDSYILGCPPSQDAIVTHEGFLGSPNLKGSTSHPGGDEESASWAGGQSKL